MAKKQKSHNISKNKRKSDNVDNTIVINHPYKPGRLSLEEYTTLITVTQEILNNSEEHEFDELYDISAEYVYCSHDSYKVILSYLNIALNYCQYPTYYQKEGIYNIIREVIKIVSNNVNEVSKATAAHYLGPAG